MPRQLMNEDDLFEVRETDLALSLTFEPDPEAVYTLRALTLDVVKQVYRQHTKHRKERLSGRLIDVTDDSAARDAILDLAIVSWQGVTDKGQPAPCDLDHKKRLPVSLQGELIERAQVGPTEADTKESFRTPA